MENLVKLIALLIVMLMCLRERVHLVRVASELKLPPIPTSLYITNGRSLQRWVARVSDEFSEQANSPKYPVECLSKFNPAFNPKFQILHNERLQNL